MWGRVKRTSDREVVIVFPAGGNRLIVGEDVRLQGRDDRVYELPARLDAASDCINSLFNHVKELRERVEALEEDIHMINSRVS